MPLSEQDRQEFAALTERFREALPQRLATIEQCRVVDEPYRGDSLCTLFRVVHQLVGTGRAFGFEAITELAEAPEAILRDLLDGRRELSSSLTRTLDGQLDLLCAELVRQAPPD